jgi:L-malate glycosyltransferase
LERREPADVSVLERDLVFMHICYVADASSVHVHRWASFFLDEGHQVSIITDVPGDIPGAEVYNVGDLLPSVRIPGISAGLQIMAKVRHIRRIIRVIQPDIVHGHYATNYGFLAALSGFQPLFQTVHGSDVLVDASGSWEQRWFVRYALQKAVRITVVADHMAERVSAMGIPTERLLVHQYGVDTERFSPPVESSVRGQYRIVSTRMFEWKYNVGELVHAAPAVIARVPRAEFVLVGDGTDRDQIEGLVAASGVGASISLVGRQTHGDIPDLLRSAAVYVSTSVTDGTSLSLLEAMACGAFPVVTDIPGNRSWVVDGENGFLFPTGNPEVLADRIAIALEDQDLRANVVARNLEMVRTRGEYRSSMKIIEAEYERVLR